MCPAPPAVNIHSSSPCTLIRTRAAHAIPARRLNKARRYCGELGTAQTHGCPRQPERWVADWVLDLLVFIPCAAGTSPRTPASPSQDETLPAVARISSHSRVPAAFCASAVRCHAGHDVGTASPCPRVSAGADRRIEEPECTVAAPLVLCTSEELIARQVAENRVGEGCASTWRSEPKGRRPHQSFRCVGQGACRQAARPPISARRRGAAASVCSRRLASSAAAL